MGRTGKADLIVIPESAARPGLIDRIKGYTLKILQNHTDIPVVLGSADGTAKLCTVRGVSKVAPRMQETAIRDSRS
ncbi:MAG: hypothetical protein Ct9H300mP11_31400 [Chloroflexota bacterium]|nr:MAG: hypothetical protein Ct9H300mP11_31400 [Chloroflexota bacterium]